ncbi:MAG: nucleotidyl transferase AbiEii/AbiGii toxin family protein [Actinobacteria bacterium]|nr:nucleotidyl transferase AbiEii/AbiGii toxin family protein [Actinomycetota bacterium]
MSRPTRSTAAGRAYLDLQNRARAEGRGTQELLTLYVIERWLARLSASPYRDQFVLKGGMLLAAFDVRRPTADLDALARNLANDEAAVVSRICAVAAQPVAEDGVEFKLRTVTSRVIRESGLYSGVRIAMDCALASAIVKLRIDVNFGDPVIPAPQLLHLPALRPGGSHIAILGYPVETILAEKISTAVTLGPANTRVRDYADLYTLTGTRDLLHAAVREALLATSAHRQAGLVPLSSVLGNLVGLRARAYAAYRTGLGPDGGKLPEDFSTVVSAVVTFADRLVEEAERTITWNCASRSWH